MKLKNKEGEAMIRKAYVCPNICVIGLETKDVVRTSGMSAQESISFEGYSKFWW